LANPISGHSIGTGTNRDDWAELEQVATGNEHAKQVLEGPTWAQFVQLVVASGAPIWPPLWQDADWLVDERRALAKQTGELSAGEEGRPRWMGQCDCKWLQVRVLAGWGAAIRRTKSRS